MQIKVYIRPDGEVEISVEGVKGRECTKLTEFLERELGEVTDKELKPAYYERATVIQKLPAGLD
jgi:acylphosphatase